MRYLRTKNFRPTSGALGFTPEEERELIVAARGEAAEEKKQDEMLEILRGQERLRMITAGATIVGLLYTLARMGDFVAELRRRRSAT